MAATLQANSPLAEQLSNIVQPKLVDIGWSSGGIDDSALAEYIILMLVNGKTQEQIASELSNDLLNLGPEEQGGAQDFAKWLFEQVDRLHAEANGSASAPTSEPAPAQAIPSFTGQELQPALLSGENGAQDAEMDDVMEGSADASMYSSLNPNLSS